MPPHLAVIQSCVLIAVHHILLYSTSHPNKARGLVDRLPQRKLGRPLLLGETLDQQVQAYLSMLGDSGGVINTSIAIAAATVLK